MATLGVSAPSQLILAAMSPGVDMYNSILQPSLQGTFLTFYLHALLFVLMLTMSGSRPLLVLVVTVSRVALFASGAHCIRVGSLSFGAHFITLSQKDGSPSQFIRSNVTRAMGKMFTCLPSYLITEFHTWFQHSGS